MVIVRGLIEGAHYVALSYVWGDQEIMKREMNRKMPLRLKAAVRLDDFGGEVIPLPEILPCTIGDSILVTRSIGYRYLWVDSLCIVQDDAADVESQLGMMGEIYGNANLNIAAGSELRTHDKFLSHLFSHLSSLSHLNLFSLPELVQYCFLIRPVHCLT